MVLLLLGWKNFGPLSQFIGGQIEVLWGQEICLRVLDELRTQTWVLEPQLVSGSEDPESGVHAMHFGSYVLPGWLNNHTASTEERKETQQLSWRLLKCSAPFSAPFLLLSSTLFPVLNLFNCGCLWCFSSCPPNNLPLSAQSCRSQDICRSCLSTWETWNISRVQ